MADLLITADCHLVEEDPDARLDVLEWICEQAREEGVEALLIAGDLFNSSSAARQLRDRVEEMFRRVLGEDRPVLMVAGNHDENLAQLGWTGNVHVLGPGDSIGLEGTDPPLRVHGMPYRRGESYRSPGELFEFQNHALQVLLAHASYLSDRHRSLLDRILDQDEENAFLLHEEDFQHSEFDELLLGHWHGYQVFEGDPPARYVGSPLPNNRLEEGQKSVLLGEVEAGQLTFRRRSIPSPPGWFHENLETLVMPGFEEEFFENLEPLWPPGHSGCEVNLVVEGFTDWDSERFRRRLREEIDRRDEKYRRVDLTDRVGSAEEFDAPLVQRLLAKLQDVNPDEVLELDGLIGSDEPNRVYETARSLLDRRSDDVAHRAQKMLMESLFQVLES